MELRKRLPWTLKYSGGVSRFASFLNSWTKYKIAEQMSRTINAGSWFEVEFANIVVWGCQVAYWQLRAVDEDNTAVAVPVSLWVFEDCTTDMFLKPIGIETMSLTRITSLGDYPLTLIDGFASGCMYFFWCHESEPRRYKRRRLAHRLRYYLV